MNGDVTSVLLNGGPFAIFLLLIILDKIGTNGERDRLRVENTELRGEIRDLNKDLRENVTPLLNNNTETLKRYAEFLENLEAKPTPRRRPS